ncbi:hypothetical protein PYCCODRAFT_1472372 [Trametes coccinea BRFM310]|uniref:Uncharacterized protein n=1 Tax=Trametes coccinea (strain BRFM310) TaxID=1353009 RepID=A0A1Y2I6J8_TRAC3|nr:hypothetical protein PYCCODRAFT_1472372 [Trametes coccinea BRFM310]
MATRPNNNNKKRKGRNHAPPRERTVTTLTNATEGSFLGPPPPSLPLPPLPPNPTTTLLHDDAAPPDPSVPGAPSATATATAAALLSPHLSYPLNVSPPIATFSDHWNALSSAPSYPLSFSSNLNAFPMTPLAGPPFHPQHSPPHFFPPHQPQSQPALVGQNPSQQALTPGQSDLEILERLKETIKKNQHEIFRPVPQPAALASVYLGPKPPLPSLVPPHPEQVPKDPSPPGLNLYADDNNAKPKSDSSAAHALGPPASRVSHPQPSHPRDAPKKPARRSTVSESPKFNVLSAPHLSFVANADLPHDIQQAAQQSPAGKRHMARYDSGASFSHNKSDAASAPPPKQHDDADMGPPGLGRYAPVPANPHSPANGARNEPAASPVISHDAPPPKLSSENGKEDVRAREPDWGSRSGSDSRQRYETDRPSGGRPVPESPRMANPHASTNGNGSRVLPPREQRIQDRDRDRDREPEKEKEYERDRGRLPPREESTRDDRPRTTDSRRLSRSPDARRYESRFPPRRYSKASEGSFTSPRLPDRSPPKPGPFRNLGEERAIVRPPANATASRPSLPDERRAPAEERSTRPAPPAVDDKRGPAVPAAPERSMRVTDDRPPRPPSPLLDRSARPVDRRPPSPPANERAGIGHDDRRRVHTPPPLGDRVVRPADDRRAPVPVSPPVSAEHPVRAVDDRRPASSVAQERPVLSTSAEDRRPPLPASGDRSARPAVVERHVPLEHRLSRPLPTSLPDSVPARPVVEERLPRPPPHDDRAARPPVPLEERISRGPSLQERLSGPPVRPDDKPAPLLKDRLSWPANSPPSVEERLSNTAAHDERPLRAQPDDRPLRPALPLERPIARHAVDRDRSTMAEPARHPPPPPASRAEERIFTPAERFTRPVTPAGSDRGHPAPPPARPYRAPSVAAAREEAPRSFRPSSPGRSPVRSEGREFRPAAAGAGEPRERERLSYRPGPGPEDRYVPAPERRAAPTPAPVPPPAPAPPLMDVDSVHTHVVETRLTYRRPSPPPGDPYPPRDRAWVPAGEPYREAEPVRRPPPEPHSFSRDWRDGERPYGDEWGERSWERPREYDRERFVERDAAPPAWETREERERRAGYAAEAAPPVPRTYERPLSARLTDAYPPEDRAYLDRGRYPPPVEPPAPYSRVRPRSPSPLRRSGASDDMRPPPLKRAREEHYGAAVYYPDEPLPPPTEYPPRLRTPAPPPPPPPGGAYYDDPRYPPSPGRLERDFLEMREREYAPPYDRRELPPPRMPPPPPPARSPPPLYGRAPYGRDDRRY